MRPLLAHAGCHAPLRRVRRPHAAAGDSALRPRPSAESDAEVAAALRCGALVARGSHVRTDQVSGAHSLTPTRERERERERYSGGTCRRCGTHQAHAALGGGGLKLSLCWTIRTGARRAVRNAFGPDVVPTATTSPQQRPWRVAAVIRLSEPHKEAHGCRQGDCAAKAAIGHRPRRRLCGRAAEPLGGRGASDRRGVP